MAEKYIKLSDAKKAIEDYRSELTVSKYGSLEACMDAKFAVTGAMKELDYIPAADVAPKSEVDKLEYTLLGVMHSVDKWLDGDELEQDEVNRAITMREKTLRIIESAKSEVAREIFEEVDSLFDLACHMIGIEILSFPQYTELKKKYMEGKE